MVVDSCLADESFAAHSCLDNLLKDSLLSSIHFVWVVETGADAKWSVATPVWLVLVPQHMNDIGEEENKGEKRMNYKERIY